MLAEQMRHRLERYEETDDPHNPPVRTGVAGPVVVSLWYYLAPLAIVLLLMTFVSFYWGDAAERDDALAPTTDAPALEMTKEVLPGGYDPNPRFRTTADELNFRGQQ